jgi:hypothetical protein
MGYRTHLVCKCHTCKRRLAVGGAKQTGRYDEAKKRGWVFLASSKLGNLIWLCPACARKHLPAD